MSVVAGPLIPSSGLIVELDAANLKSYPGTGTAWYDLSGNGNDATLYNGVAYTASGGGSFNFDETNDYAKINNTSVLPTTAYTKVAWFRPETNTANIISGTGTNHAFWLGNTSTTLQAGHNGSWSQISYSPGDMLNQWWHGAVTFSNSTGWVLYLNGVQVATNASTTTFPSASGVCIGSFGDASNMFDGDIPVVQIYDRALTATEIAQTFNALRGRFGI